GKTPFEALYDWPPDLSALCMWGCPVWVHDLSGSKLSIQAHEACWLGADTDSKAHHVFYP
ncbi:hypothetical protein BGY98DRAFT_886965, partial [Russula aff. rugulosa BPL654]